MNETESSKLSSILTGNVDQDFHTLSEIMSNGRDQEVLDKYSWAHIFTTENGSTYYVSESGAGFRYKQDKDLVIPQTLVTLGYLPDSFKDEERKNFHRQHDYNDGNAKTETFTSKSDETNSSLTLTVSNLSDKPEVGYFPYQISPNEGDTIEMKKNSDGTTEIILKAKDGIPFLSDHVGHGIKEIIR